MTGNPEFERLYAEFMASGGFSQRCISEDYERVRPQTNLRVMPRCPHGLTRQTCALCQTYLPLTPPPDSPEPSQE